ncbi:hypothetical protein DERF_011026 [Dermatophagoides farinae]|uniref:Uncharacterized protein n=1 Tax=Dermatophagoides farinae TaxID=6954 RepID=A0A922HRF5_DERFA|nr:hypothetical protein DERF_011026 [Dermatophagoides farinae]
MDICTVYEYRLPRGLVYLGKGAEFCSQESNARSHFFHLQISDIRRDLDSTRRTCGYHFATGLANEMAILTLQNWRQYTHETRTTINDILSSSNNSSNVIFGIQEMALYSESNVESFFRTWNVHMEILMIGADPPPCSMTCYWVSVDLHLRLPSDLAGQVGNIAGSTGNGDSVKNSCRKASSAVIRRSGQ